MMNEQMMEFCFETVAMRDGVGATMAELRSHYQIDGVEVWKDYIELHKLHDNETLGNYSISMLGIPVDMMGKPLPTDVYLQFHRINERHLFRVVVCVHGESVGFQDIADGYIRHRDGVWGPTVQANYTRLIQSD